MADIKLFVCCHQPEEVPKHPLLVPVQVGAALADSRFPGFLYDDTGENISAKNRSYCELTAQYWAWKNADADYYGFFHYRRYLYPDIRAKRPYQIEKKADISLLNRLSYEGFLDLIQQHDMILPMGENMYLPVREHYAKASFHHREDLELTEKIVREISPGYETALEQYLSGTVCYFGNIFIMCKSVFQEYCNWLFSILEEFDRRANTGNYGPQEMRVDGYLGERLLGTFYLHQRDRLDVLELPRVHFVSDWKERWTKNAFNTFFPPGSFLRALAKESVHLCEDRRKMNL